MSDGSAARAMPPAPAWVVEIDGESDERRAEAMNEATAVFLIAAGGTGGHVIPGLAVAAELRAKGRQAVIVGTPRGLENRLAAEAGFELERIAVGPLNRVSLWTKISTIVRLPTAIWNALMLLRRRRPAAVLSLGGYASGPLALAALLTRTPLVVLEPNAYPGLANRWLGRFARRALTGFDDSLRFFHPGRSETVGTPIREEFFQVANKKHSEPFMILVTGGSQGSRTLNRAAVDAARLWVERGSAQSIRLVHQVGSAEYEQVHADYQSLSGAVGLEAEAKAYLDNMPGAFAAADLVVCRAGASTLAELCAAGKASVLVPYPYAADDHQLRNAEALASARAARVVRDQEWTGERMVAEVEAILGDRDRLEKMEAAARRLARPGAARRAAEVLEELALPGARASD